MRAERAGATERVFGVRRGTHLSVLLGFLPVRVLIQLVGARGQLGALRHDLGFLSHAPSVILRQIKVSVCGSVTLLRRLERRFAGASTNGRPRFDRVARLDGVKRRAGRLLAPAPGASAPRLVQTAWSTKTADGLG